MIRKALTVACMLALAIGSATADEAAYDAGDDPMAHHMAAMMNCEICKHMMPHMQTLGPAMTMDVATLNDGIALIHGVSDPAALETYRSVNVEMAKAGEACMTMTGDEAESKLCHYCQGIHGVMQAGATMSMGPTKTGDVMVLTSDDPEVLNQIMELGAMCQKMCDMMQASM